MIENWPMMNKHLPNIVTMARIIGAICLLLVDVSMDLKSPFWILYLFCGFTDMIDGYLARRFNVESKFGATLDSVADVCLVGCCAWKLFPILNLEIWMWIWVALIALIKLINQISAGVVCGKVVFPHTIANKLTGFLLFVSIPLSHLFHLFALLIFTAMVATFAAIQEGHIIRTKND